MKKSLLAVLALVISISLALPAFSQQNEENSHLFVHLKTSLKKDDSQICIAYNIIWAALRDGLQVDVLVDADGINTFKTKFMSNKDSIQDYKIPQNLRKGIADQFSISLDDVPKTYGDFLIRLHKEEGANFYINKAFLIVANIAPHPDQDMGKISAYAAKIFKPVSLKEMVQLRRDADFDFTF